MRVLVACEESQAVCKAFIEKGHEAYSCDIIECSGGHPEWHIMQDVLEILNPITHYDTGERRSGQPQGDYCPNYEPRDQLKRM